MADRKLPELKTRIRLDTSDLDRGQSKVAAFTKSFSDPKAMAGYQSRLKGIGDQADEVGTKLTRNLTLPIVAAGAVSVKLASDFNKSFTTMTSLAGVATDEVAGLKDEVKNLASETGRSPTELAEGLYFIRSAGLDGAEAMATLEASAKGAAIGLGTTQSVADAATSAVNAYGAENLTAAEAVDVLAAAVTEGKGEAAAFAPEIGRLLPLAERLGVSFDQVAGSMAYFTRTGTPVAQAATMVEGILQKLISPTAQAREELDRIGLSTEQLQRVVSNQGLLAGLQTLNEKVKGDPAALRKVFDDIEGFNGVLGLLSNNGKDAAQVLDNVAASSETVAEAFARVQGTDEFKAQQAITDLQVAAIELGQKLVPIVADLADGVSGLVGAFSSLPGPVQTGLLALVGVAAVMGPLAKGVSLASSGIGVLLKVAASSSLDGFRLGLAGVGTEGAGAAAKVGGLLNAVGPAGIAAGVAGIGLLAFAFQQVQTDAAEAQANVDSLVASLEQGETPAEAIGKKIAATLNDAEGGFKGLGGSSSELKDDLEGVGVSITDLRDGLLGSDKDFASFIDGIQRKAKENGDPLGAVVLVKNLERFRSEASRAQESYQGNQKDLAKLGVETDKTAGATSSLTAEQLALAGATDDGTGALDDQAKAARELFDANRAVADTADGITEAQTDLADARREAASDSKENIAAAKAISDAEQAVRDAQRDGITAQDDLTEARAKARQEVDDLTLSLERAKQTETEAATAIERAKNDALKAKTPLERREAADKIAAAELALREATAKKNTTAEDLNKARDIENTDAVVAARDRVTAAADAEREAQVRVGDATRAASEIRVEQMKKVKEASEKLTDAELDHIDAQADLTAATEGTGGATDVLIVRLTNLANKLAPNDPLRKNLADYITDLREMRGLEDGSTPADTGAGVESLGPTASPGAVNAERLNKSTTKSAIGNSVPGIPNATDVTPGTKAIGNSIPSAAPIAITNEFHVTGEPDAKTLATLEDVANRVTTKALREAVGA